MALVDNFRLTPLAPKMGGASLEELKKNGGEPIFCEMEWSW